MWQVTQPNAYLKLFYADNNELIHCEQYDHGAEVFDKHDFDFGNDDDTNGQQNTTYQDFSKGLQLPYDLLPIVDVDRLNDECDAHIEQMINLSSDDTLQENATEHLSR